MSGDWRRVVRRSAVLALAIATVVIGAVVWRTTRLATFYGPRRGSLVPALPVPGGGGSEEGAWFTVGGLAELVPSLVPLVVAVAVVSVLDRRRRRRRAEAVSARIRGRGSR